jgi:chromosome segregation ATPase
MATTTTETLARRWQEESANGGVYDLALAPLVDKIAYGLAKGLVVAMKELEDHIASETRKVSDSVGKRLDSLQASVQDLSGAVAEQRAMNLAVQEQCKELAAATTSLQESDTRHSIEITALHTQTDELSVSVNGRIDAMGKDLNVQQEDISGIKANFVTFCARMDGLTERLDKQADALRSMCATYSQRETELEQLVDGLARLRAYPAPKSTNGL